MKDNQYYKNRAIESLSGKWANGAIATLILFLISGFMSSIITLPMGEMEGTSVSVLWTLACLPLSWGFAVWFLNLIRGGDYSYSRLFDGYSDFGRIFMAQFLVGLCTVIGSFLFIVPGVIIGLMYSQVSFILKDDEQISAVDAMKQSAAMMKGHKMELFMLTLSFIGWAILTCLTLGLGFFLLSPYWQTTMAHYYEDLKRDGQG